MTNVPAFGGTFTAMEFPDSRQVNLGDRQFVSREFQGWNCRFVPISRQSHREYGELVLHTFLWNGRMHFAALDDSPTVVHTHINSLHSDKYNLKKSLPIDLDLIEDGEVIASVPEAGINMSGDSITDALKSLRAEIVDSYELLTSEQKLGPGPAHQLKILRNYLGESDSKTRSGRHR